MGAAVEVARQNASQVGEEVASKQNEAGDGRPTATHAGRCS